MRIMRVLKNQNGIFLTAKYTKSEPLELGAFYALDYKKEKFYFEIVEMETSEDGAIICYLQELGHPIQEMLEEGTPGLLSEVEGLDIREFLFQTL